MSENIFFDKSKLKYCGKNVIIGKTVRIRKPEECIIGDNTIIDDFAYISCVIEIGSNCHIASHVSISGGAGKFKMGNYSTISNHCSIHCASSDYSSVSLDLPSVPKELLVTATTDTGVIMGVKHKSAPIEGVQFHPESVLTEGGHRLLANWLETCGDKDAISVSLSLPSVN